ncbi:MAG TPA: glycosyltransferase [Terracidiphilus sp.]|jgi:glycosyltransferase involved in cell wall biosynthesis
MNLRPRILLLIPHLDGGGAEKILALLARELSRDKYELHLGIVTGSKPPTGTFPPGVTIHLLGVARVRSAAFGVLGLVHRLKPQAIVSGMFHLNFLVLLLRPLFPRGTRVLVRQNGFVSASLAQDGLPASTRLLYRLLYRYADRVICQTQAMANDLAQMLNVEQVRVAVLFNPVDVEAIRAVMASNEGKWTRDGPHLLAVGRLSREKGFDLLLEAFQSVRKCFPSADLLIAGAGQDEAALKALCHALDLDSAVQFAGYVECPSAYFSGASLFVLSSRHEGMPNAMLEAAAGGLPLVALPAVGGVADLLRGQPGVWLAKEISATALAAGLQEALAALEPGQRYTHAFIDRFRMDRAVRAYEELIDNAIREDQAAV